MIKCVKNKIKEWFNNKTIIFCLTLVLIYMISGYCKWIEIGVGVVALVFFAITSIQQGFCIFLFMHCFTLSNIIYDSCFIITISCYTAVLLIKYILGVKNGKYNVNKQLIIWLLVFMLISIAISLPQPKYPSSTLYLNYFVLFYLFFAMRKEFSLNQGINYMLFGLILSCTLGVISLILPHYQYNPYIFERFNAMTNQTNYLYMRAMFLLTYFMYQFLNDELKVGKFITLYAICALIVLSTLSKFGIGLLALFTIIFIILYLKKDFKQGIKVIGLFIILALVVCLICYKLVKATFNRFFEVGDGSLGSMLTGRDDIWGDYWNAFCKNPFTILFGNGLMADEVFITTQGKTRASHSLYMFLLYRFGIIGVLALLYIIYLFIRNINKKRPKLIAYLPLVWLLIESLCENTFKCYNIMYFVLAGMILFKDSKPKENIEQASISNEKTIE